MFEYVCKQELAGTFFSIDIAVVVDDVVVVAATMFKVKEKGFTGTGLIHCDQVHPDLFEK